MVFAGGAETADLYRRVVEALAHLGPLRRRQRDLDAVLVRRPELDAVHADLGQVLDDGRDIPVLGDVVGDGADFKARARASAWASERSQCSTARELLRRR